MAVKKSWSRRLANLELTTQTATLREAQAGQLLSVVSSGLANVHGLG